MSNYITICAYALAINMLWSNICHVCLVLEFSSATLAKSLKEAVADPWMALLSKQQVVVCRAAYRKRGWEGLGGKSSPGGGGGVKGSPFPLPTIQMQPGYMCADLCCIQNFKAKV